MNMNRIDSWILSADQVIKDNEIPQNGVVKKTYRGQISTFGKAVLNGSLKAAIALFSNSDKNSTVDRRKLIKAMYQLITSEKNADPMEIFTYVCQNDSIELVEMFIDASIAIKLAFNNYCLVDNPEDYKDGKLKNDKGDSKCKT